MGDGQQITHCTQLPQTAAKQKASLNSLIVWSMRAQQHSNKGMLTTSSTDDVCALDAGKGTLVGSHTNILKDEGSVKEEQVIDIWGERW